MTMKHFFKQNFNLTTLGFFMVAIFILATPSCKKEEYYYCDCDGNDDEKTDYTRFFIAHAGGAIDDINYTNCLEALDLSYSKGCKLFELDLIKTTDNKFVAAHHWEHYKTITDYSGTMDDTPLSEEEFLSFKIHGKYTPMNMDAINLWFQNHPDAILVTDKTNEPEKIYNDFLFRDRVIMELFSWDAIDKAIELGIRPLVTDGLFFGTPDIEQVFEDKKIEYFGMGYYRMQGNEDLLRRLKKKGLKNYVWSLEVPVNGKPAEYHVWDYEMNFCYGMYANDLDLLTSLLNEQLVQ